MSRVYDNWERLVGAIFKREELRQIALSSSFSSAGSSDFSSNSSSPHHLSAPYGLIGPFYNGLRFVAFKEIKKATGNFKPGSYLGEGELSIVYKGWIYEDTLNATKGFMRVLSRSVKAVVIKIWKRDPEIGSEMWLRELEYLSQLDHPNVVKLMAYSSERDNLFFVYERMRKGSLINYLKTRGHQTLSWDKRIKVAIDAARGLSFLHHKEVPIIHGDFHAGNILLDEDFNAKLAGFFFAKDGPVPNKSLISTPVMLRDTFGIAASEHLDKGHLAKKCDVHAFGTLLLQILSGRDFVHLTRWFTPHTNGTTELALIMDTKLNGRYPRDGALNVLSLAFRCLNSNPELRPGMDEVLVALQQLQS